MLLSRAADSICDGDLVDKQIRTKQNWNLLPTQVSTPHSFCVLYLWSAVCKTQTSKCQCNLMTCYSLCFMEYASVLLGVEQLPINDMDDLMLYHEAVF